MSIIKRKRRWVWVVLLVTLWLLCSGMASATPLLERLSQFPQWDRSPPVGAVRGDLLYPAWFAGTWTVTATLVDMAAPFAPDLVSPGFESNRQYLNEPVRFQARFIQPAPPSAKFPPFLAQLRLQRSGDIVADRAFNGLNLTRAYLNQAEAGLGDCLVRQVKVDPADPNRQVTLMKGDRQLTSRVIGRAVEVPCADASRDGCNQFVATEVMQQVFRGIPQPYINQVETTTAYHYQPDQPAPITADQATAVYLSPQDPNYFVARSRPVALYRYQLMFERASKRPE
ncbi:MAG: hypothetical protein VKK04_12375 [Synechococcales bacterium]|nr:hypothetical protein [Synechococcales bacterium]